MKKIMAVSAAAVAILLMSSVGYAENRPHEGKIVSIQTVEKSVEVPGGEKVGNTERSMVDPGRKRGPVDALLGRHHEVQEQLDPERAS